MEVFLPLAGVVLGALIAGLFTLLANRYNFERQNRKDILNQKNKNLDEIVTYAIEYFSYGGALLAAIDGVSKDIELKGKPNSDAKSFLDKHDIEFINNSNNIEYCHAKLLINFPEQERALKLLWDFKKVFSEIRNSVFRGKDLSVPHQQEMEKYREELGRIRTDFFVELKSVAKNA
ncbi:hypothetical protein WKI13_00675 [Teredinibacter turnerae]|uniref:hypothetical protein n=1 Tax=Teredinibacter turnerae TaxID=2426 RepID=UPI000375F85A|nr:hypothetical protein [Teredinibacter turnerae]